MSPHDTEHGFIAEDGTKIAYRAWWPARVARRGLILLHRGHEHAGRLAGVAHALDLAETAVFAWDARGHGSGSGCRWRGRRSGSSGASRPAPACGARCGRRCSPATRPSRRATRPIR